MIIRSLTRHATSRLTSACSHFIIRLRIGDGTKETFLPLWNLTFSTRAQFARRDAVYFHPNTAKSPDAFIIICTITASPTPPTPVPAAPVKSVPKDLLDAVGNLLDDPLYSDVEFILPSRPSGGSKPRTRTIWAARRLLKRAEYFEASEPHAWVSVSILFKPCTSVRVWLCGSFNSRSG